MRLITLLLVLTMFLSCNPNTKDQKTLSNQNEIISNDSKTLKDIDFDKESIYDVTINGQKWADIEIGGDSDTALTLYAYRMLFTEQKEQMYDCEIRYNLYQRDSIIKVIFLSIFKEKSKEYKIDFMLDSLNESSIKYAKEQVEKDIEEYGESDGPCFDLYQLGNRK